ncbi:uncharacterized protein LOC134851853 [Symsagittifera roscoffensis]|uniref:uncharacterized protein LOC134851853 n=1 Tax=Symsagittifera roscoffensis TaxID=84072 RepID=UPI00307C4D37
MDGYRHYAGGHFDRYCPDYYYTGSTLMQHNHNTSCHGVGYSHGHSHHGLLHHHNSLGCPEEICHSSYCGDSHHMKAVCRRRPRNYTFLIGILQNIHAEFGSLLSRCGC